MPAIRSAAVVLLGVACLALFSACNDDADFIARGSLGFDKDTVNFDTLFQNTPSPSERLWIFNNTSNDLSISKVSIEGGEDSPFQLILNGDSGQVHEDIRLLEGDSILAFMDMEADVAGDHRTITDMLRFEVGDEVQRIPLVSRVLNAFLVRDSILPCNHTLPSDTLIVVDGLMVVDSNCTCRIDPGTELFFTSRKNASGELQSAMIVDGTLDARGTSGNEILITNNRLDDPFDQTPGQWFGIVFTRSSNNSVIEHATIQNGAFGIRVDSTAENSQTAKLILRNLTVRNMSNFGILGLGAAPNLTQNDVPQILAENVLAYNCGRAAAGLLFGGSYIFRNCTFAGGCSDFSPRNDPIFAVSNSREFTEDGQQVVEVFPTFLGLYNSIIWGPRRNEAGLGLRGGAPAVADLRNNILKVDTSLDITYDPSNQLNLNPQYVDANCDTTPFPFLLEENSPAVDASDDQFGTPPDDRLGDARAGAADLGALEFKDN